jgi:hypothetical protein
MPYKLKPLSSFHEHFFRMATEYQRLSAPRRVEFSTPSKADATSQRWKINEFRAGLRREGAITLYPDFDRATLMIRAEATASNPNAWKIIICDPEMNGSSIFAFAEQLAKMNKSNEGISDAKNQAINQATQPSTRHYQLPPTDEVPYKDPAKMTAEEFYAELLSPKDPPQSGG